MISILKVPYLGTAEDDVVLRRWFFSEGDSFKKGQSLAAVETLKASFEVEAEDDGVLLRHLAAEGSRVAIQGPLGVLGAADEPADEGAISRLLADCAAAPTPPPRLEASRTPAEARKPSGRVAAAPAARRRAAELGVDLEKLRGTGPSGLIRAADVEAASQGSSEGASAEGTLDPAFLGHLRREREAFAALSSDFKVALYRRHGARIGRGTRLGPGAVILAERLILGEGCFFGQDTEVEAAEFVAGDLLCFGPRSRVRARRLVFGDNAYFAPDVEIGGGGAMDPEAELVVGSHGFVGEHAHLNPCRPLILGDEVVISRSAVLMTHSFGGSLLGGYPNRFAGVRIGDGCQIGIHATLFPGAEMGAGSILLSGSSLVSAVPPGRLYGGVPARDLKAATQPLSPREFVDRSRDLVIEFARQMELRGFSVGIDDGADELRLSVTRGDVAHVLRFAPEITPDLPSPAAEEIRVRPHIPDGAWSDEPLEVVTIDLSVPRIRGTQGPLADAFREFLRKRGIRLRPQELDLPGRVAVSSAIETECRYSLPHYRHILRLAKERGTWLPKVRDVAFGLPERGFFLIRHDVDISPWAALEMAELEHAEGVETTYYFRLHAPYYNLLDARALEIVKRIAEMGHEVGLHYEPGFFIDLGRDPVEGVRRDIATFEYLVGFATRTIAQHQPAEGPLLGEISPDHPCAYQPALVRDIPYFGDSGFHWREGCICTKLDRPRVHTLIHPHSWTIFDRPWQDVLRGHAADLSARMREEMEAYIRSVETYLAARPELDRQRAARYE